MSKSYTQCSECGKRALSIATRCPGCGRELPARVVPDRRSLVLARFVSAPVVLGVVAVGALLATAWQGQRIVRSAEVESSFVAAELPAVDPLAGTPRLDTATVAAAPAGSAGELLVARTWTHVRSRRSVKGGLTAVLMPGDTVLADSLGQGWYRVALEGEVMGYAHRSTLAR